MVPGMKISSKGLELIKQYEKEEQFQYLDSAGLPTIGYGHLLTKSELMSGYIKINDKSVCFHDNDGLLHDETIALLDQDLDPVEHIVNKLVNVSLTQNQFDALVILTFNIGNGGFAESTALKMINAKKFAEVPDAIMRWNKITDPKTHKKVVSKG